MFISYYIRARGTSQVSVYLTHKNKLPYSHPQECVTCVGRRLPAYSGCTPRYKKKTLHVRPATQTLVGPCVGRQWREKGIQNLNFHRGRIGTSKIFIKKKLIGAKYFPNSPLAKKNLIVKVTYLGELKLTHYSYLFL